MRELKALQKDIYQTAVKKGWWDNPKETGTLIALMHSELSEALEWDRHGNPESNHIAGFSGVEEELADVIIRILDFAEGHRMDVLGAVIAKHEFNKGRAFKHGGKEY